MSIKRCLCRVVGRIAFCLPILLLAHPSLATVYEVGPGKPYDTIGNVPIAGLAAGDTVSIYPKAGNAPYYEKVAIGNSGTALAPITLQGVPDASGNLPVLDGTNAVQVGSASNLDRGLIQTGSGSSGSGNYIVIQNLELRNADYTNQYVRGGTYYAYAENAAGVFVQNGTGVVIRNCWSHGNGNGIQSNGKSQGVTNLLIEACRVEGNGVVLSGGAGSSQEHNFYVGAEPVTVQYCYIGGLRSGADGQNYKDRSSGTIFRYNWINGGPNDQFDLVQGGTVPANAYVYGNVIVKTNETGNGRMSLFGTDGSGNRQGTFYFMNNTFISTRSSTQTTVFQVSSGNTVQAYNNIMYCPSGGSNLVIRNGGTVVCSTNWISPGYNAGAATMSNTVPLSGNTPGFVNYATEDFHLLSTSACVNAGALTWPMQNLTTPVCQPINPQSYELRFADSHVDIGAYEYVPPPPRVVAVTPALAHVDYKEVPLTAIAITFDRDVTITAGMISVQGVSTGPNTAYTFNYDSMFHVATLQWAGGLPNDTYRVSVSDAVTAGGVVLDGELNTLSPALPSGDGTPGGSFSCLVYRLVGDVNEDRSVDVVDLLTMVATFGLSGGQPGFDSTCDLNNDDGVDVVDLLGLVDSWGTSLPAAAATAVGVRS